MVMWQAEIGVHDSGESLVNWINSIPDWPQEEREDDDNDENFDGTNIFSGKGLDNAPSAVSLSTEASNQEPPSDAGEMPPAPPSLVKQVSSGSAKLEIAKARLDALEKEQASLEVSDETTRKDMAGEGSKLYAQLDKTVKERLATLTAAAKTLAGRVTSLASKTD